MYILHRKNQMGLSLILCVDGEFHSAQYIGNRVGITAKFWKTESGAQIFADQRWNLHTVSDYHCSPINIGEIKNFQNWEIK